MYSAHAPTRFLLQDKRPSVNPKLNRKSRISPHYRLRLTVPFVLCLRPLHRNNLRTASRLRGVVLRISC